MYGVPVLTILYSGIQNFSTVLTKNKFPGGNLLNLHTVVLWVFKSENTPILWGTHNPLLTYTLVNKDWSKKQVLQGLNMGLEHMHTVHTLVKLCPHYWTNQYGKTCRHSSRGTHCTTPTRYRLKLILCMIIFLSNLQGAKIDIASRNTTQKYQSQAVGHGPDITGWTHCTKQYPYCTVTSNDLCI